jgi:hypothetical protein
MQTESFRTTTNNDAHVQNDATSAPIINKRIVRNGARD